MTTTTKWPKKRVNIDILLQSTFCTACMGFLPHQDTRLSLNMLSIMHYKVPPMAWASMQVQSMTRQVPHNQLDITTLNTWCPATSKNLSMANKCTKGNRNIRWTKLFKFSHCTLVALVHNSHQNAWWSRQLCYMVIVVSWSTVYLLVSSTTQQTWQNNKDQQSTSWSTYATGTLSIFFQYLHTTTISISYQATSSCFPHEILPLAVPRNFISCCAMKSRHVQSHDSAASLLRAKTSTI